MNVLVETERLLITEMTMDMVMDVHKNSLDEDTRRFVPDEVFETLEDAKETVEFLMAQYGSADGPQVYAVILKGGNKNIGYVQLVPIGEGKWEIGYHMAKQYTCKGYATEAVTAFLPIMAKEVGIEEVYGIRLLENVASGRVLDKCGFENFFEGEGEYHDGVYEISKSVWRKNSFNMVFNRKSQNPWREISLEDYENHMSLDSVMQLQTLNKMMKTQLSDYDVSTVMILGVAGGNGLEHIDKNKYKKVYGVDINESYLKKVAERYSSDDSLGGILECILADLTKDAESLPGAELVIADLLIEYIGYDAFATVTQFIKPKYVSCIIQINTDTKNWVSDSPYLHSFDGLDAVHHQMDEKNLIKTMVCKGYVHTGSTTEMLPNGKALVRVDFTKN